MVKSFKEISWNVTEEEYRKDSALSYSTLAKYERSGFNGLNTLFDKVESPSLTFGSAVDTLITGSEEDFDNLFFVADFTEPADSVKKVVKKLFDMYKDEYQSLSAIPNDKIIVVTEDLHYQLNWKAETRAKVIKEQGLDYYSLLYVAQTKQILSTSVVQDVYKAVLTLKTNNATEFYFKSDSPFDDSIERLYQLKFKATFNNINYRCMSDLLVVDHSKKIVYPIDLKTSSHTEWDFYKSFIEWNYQIQSRLYWRIIRRIMDEDEIFKDYTLDDYRFIVINKTTLTPLVWKFEQTKEYGVIQLGKNKTVVFRDPFDIGKELTYYLDKHPNVPLNITNKDNSLIEWINNNY